MLRNYIIYFLSFFIFINVVHAVEIISGYKGAKWGWTYKKVKTAVPTTELQGNCLDFQFTLTKEAPEILKKYTTIVGVKFRHDDLINSPYKFSKDITYKPVDKGCGLFYKDKFIAYEMVMYSNNRAEINTALTAKYGEPKYENNTYIFDQNDGKIFLFESRVKLNRYPHVVYVSGDLKFMVDGYDKAKNDEQINLQKEKALNQKKLNDL